jgi:predicted signal transduction protein with EAL and GGDEF domain
VLALEAVRLLDAGEGERISCGVAARANPADGPAELLRAADQAQYRAKRAGHGVDVVVAGDDQGEPPPTAGRDRVYRAADPDARLARELLKLLDNMNGASAEERLAQLRARLELES